MIELSPSLILTTWAAGLAGVAAVVAWWRIVGPGFIWLAASVTVLFGGIGAISGGGWAAWVATSLVLGAIPLATRDRMFPAVLFGGAAVFYLAAAVPDGSLVGSLTGAATLGGITGEMLLGHWYLIDPTMPRWALKRLIAVGGAGMVLDGVFVLVEGGFDRDVIGWAFLLLAVTTVVLSTAVWFALNEPSYPGVMAATGLSYLAILTAAGAVVAGRSLIDDGSTLLGVGGDLPGTLLLL